MHEHASSGYDVRRHTRAVRWASVRLVVLYVIGLVATVVVFVLPFYLLLRDSLRTAPGPTWGVLGTIACFALLVIGGRSIHAWRRLSRNGGAAVAEELGGTPLDQLPDTPDHRQLREMVHELASRGGVPTPRIFVLTEESGINALTAGSSPQNAVIAVTQGALTALDREELRGVLGHEVGHIAARDVRLGVRLAAGTAGLDTFGRLGRWLMSGTMHGTTSMWEAAMWGFGAVMYVVGAVGHLFASVLEAAVGRRRELLADTAAVRLTGRADGLISAFRTMRRTTPGTAIVAVDATSVDSMLVWDGLVHRDFMMRALESHPSFEKRVASLERLRAG